MRIQGLEHGTREGAGHRRTLIFFGAALLLETAVMRMRGLRVGGNVVVRCQKGHLFTTIWIPGASLKSLRLAWWRFQRCPVGHHWSIVTPVKESELSEHDMALARKSRDIRIP